MSAAPTRQVTITVPPELRALAVTALLLEKLDRLPRAASAAQYREVVQRVQALLDEARQAPGPEVAPALEQLLAASPALAELWENGSYAVAGLCRSPLESATRAEIEAAALIERLRR